VDPARREIQFGDGARLDYDNLVLATGAGHAYFGHDEWEAFAPGLKSLEDALEIRRRILLAFERADREPDPARRRRLLTFAIVGAGATGVELAGAIGDISRHVLIDEYRHIDPREARIVLLEAGLRILPAFSEESSRRGQKLLERRGVEVRTQTAVTGVDGEGVSLGSERLETATVLWAAGVATSSLTRQLGVPLDRAGRVIVEPDLSIPGHPEVFVIGDLAAYLHQTGAPLPGLSPVAMQQGRHAARTIRRRLEGRPPRAFRYFDKGTMAVIGRSAAVAEIHGLRLWGFPAWLAWCFVHIFFLIGFRNRFLVMFEWAWAYFTYQRGARLITGVADERKG
jgi:NADH dehydrogenase